jgi:haloalkane dehalogenase
VGGGKLSKAEQMMYLDPTRERPRRKIQHDWFRSIVNSEDYLTDLRARLESIRQMPVLLTFADDDPTYKAGWVDRYESIFDNTRVALIHESDHFPQEHDPAAMVTAIRTWYGDVVG